MIVSVFNRYRFYFKQPFGAVKLLAPKEFSSATVAVLYEGGLLKLRDIEDGLCHIVSPCSNLLHFARENGVRPITRVGDAKNHKFFIHAQDISRFIETLGNHYSDFMQYVLSKIEADKKAEVLNDHIIGQW